MMAYYQGAGATFAAVSAALLAAHQVADHWAQTDGQAARKGIPGWTGRRACAAHVATYTLVTGLTVGLAWAALGLPITPAGFIAGQAVSAVTHYWADRRTTLRWLADRVGQAQFYRLGTPRPDHDDNPSLGTGAYALDQSFHWWWLFVAALVTAVMG